MAENPNSTTQTETKKTVFVGCKLPHGLYLDLRDEQGNIIARHKLPGCSNFTLPNPNRKFMGAPTVHGDTLTEIPGAHWEAWLKKNKNHPAIRSGAIYAAANQADATARAKEHQGDNVGFDRLNPEKQLGVKKMTDTDNPNA